MKRLPGSVWVLGIVSLFNDMASEMLYPVLPIFITQVPVSYTHLTLPTKRIV